MHQADLFAAIALAPDDDQPRLVWADWLEERGEVARAEFVRVQCALARAEPTTAEALVLKRREHELLARHGRAWLAEVGEIEGVQWTRYHRGLLVGAEVPDLATLIARADEILARAPISEVTVGAPDLPPGLAALPWLRSLTFHEVYDLTPAQLEPLLDAPLVGSLRALRLVDCGVENPGALAIAASPALKHLEELDLSGCFVGEVGGIALARADHLRGLRRLRFGSYGSGYAEDPFLTDAAIEAFVDPAGPVRPLEELNLDLSRVTSAGVRRLLGTDRLPALSTVSLRWCSQVTGSAFEGDAGPGRWRHLVIDAMADAVPPLVRLPQLSELWSLSADNCQLTPLTAAALADAPFRRTLRSLSLRHGRMSGETFAALVERPWPALSRLRVGPGNQLDAAAAGLLTRDTFPALLELDVQGNPIGDDGAAAIAAALGDQLQELSLRQCKVEAPGARSLAAATFPRLASLSMAGNALTPDGARAIGAADWPALSALDLASTHADDTFLEALAANPAVHRLLSLTLDSCTDLTAAGLHALASAAPAALRALSMSYNHRLGAEGLDTLCAPGAMPALTHLTMGACGLSGEALDRLASSALFAQLCWVSCYGNPASRETLARLSSKARSATPDWRDEPEE